MSPCPKEGHFSKLSSSNVFCNKTFPNIQNTFPITSLKNLSLFWVFKVTPKHVLPFTLQYSFSYTISFIIPPRLQNSLWISFSSGYSCLTTNYFSLYTHSMVISSSSWQYLTKWSSINTTGSTGDSGDTAISHFVQQGCKIMIISQIAHSKSPCQWQNPVYLSTSQ